MHIMLVMPDLKQQPPPVSPDDLRSVMGRFATGVAVVTATHPGLGPFGSTANSVSSVSLDPPLVLVCLRSESETLAALEASGGFAINVLAEHQRHLADRFAKAATPAHWEGVPHAPGLTGSPLIADTLAAVECELHELADGGDHRIAIGRVLGLRDTAEPAPPLLFAESRYHALGEPLAPAAPEVPLPSRLGDLRVCLREWSDDGSVALVAVAGDPRGRPGAAVYVHRGCLVGDLLGGCCHSRDALHRRSAASPSWAAARWSTTARRALPRPVPPRAGPAPPSWTPPPRGRPWPPPASCGCARSAC